MSNWQSKWEGAVLRCFARRRNGFGQESERRVETPDWIGADLGRRYGCKERRRAGLEQSWLVGAISAPEGRKKEDWEDTRRLPLIWLCRYSPRKHLLSDLCP